MQEEDSIPFLIDSQSKKNIHVNSDLVLQGALLNSFIPFSLPYCYFSLLY